MNKELIIYDLFERTSKYRQPKKESLKELRDCYKHYSFEYISAADFLKELNNLGFQSNKYGEVKLRMKKGTRKKDLLCVRLTKNSREKKAAKPHAAQPHNPRLSECVHLARG